MLFNLHNAWLFPKRIVRKKVIEIDKARKILKPSDDKISTPSSPLKQENANVRSFGR